MVGRNTRLGGKRYMTATAQQRISMSTKGGGSSTSSTTDPVQNNASSSSVTVANNASILARKPLQHYNRRLAQAPPSAATVRCTQLLLMDTSKTTHRRRQVSRNASKQSCWRAAAAATAAVRTNVESTARNADAPTNARRSLTNKADKFSATAPLSLPSLRCTDIWGATTGLDVIMATAPSRPKSAPRICVATETTASRCRHHQAHLSGTKRERARCTTTDIVGSSSNSPGNVLPTTDAAAGRQPAKRQALLDRHETVDNHSLNQRDPSSMMKPTPLPPILTQRASSSPVEQKGSLLLRTEPAELSSSSSLETSKCNVSLSILPCNASTTTTRRPVRRSRLLPPHNCDMHKSTTLDPESNAGAQWAVLNTTSHHSSVLSDVTATPRPTTLSVAQESARPLSGMGPPKRRHVSAAWEPMARPTAATGNAANAAVTASGRRNNNQGNYVRLNLRNKAGSCRGARNVKAKSKASHQREQFKQQRNSRVAAEDHNDSNWSNGGFGGSFTAAAPLAATNGLDTIDDYVDGVLQAPPVASRSSKQRARSTAAAIPLCRGHSQPCKRLTVKKTGPNKGRVFFVCGGPRGEQCHHFEWADDTVQVSLLCAHSERNQLFALMPTHYSLCVLYGRRRKRPCCATSHCRALLLGKWRHTRRVSKS
jgi:GRF zinc finger